MLVVQNMVGASGITATNWLYNAAPKDGTVIATFVHTVPFEPLMGNSRRQVRRGEVHLDRQHGVDRRHLRGVEAAGVWHSSTTCS